MRWLIVHKLMFMIETVGRGFRRYGPLKRKNRLPVGSGLRHVQISSCRPAVAAAGARWKDRVAIVIGSFMVFTVSADEPAGRDKTALEY